MCAMALNSCSHNADVCLCVCFFFCAANRLTGVSVFVGNLPASTKRTQLEALFTPHTKVLRIRFRKPNGGQLFKTKRTSLASLIAFVDVPTAEEAKKVAAALHQHNFRGNLLRVSADKQENTSGNEKRTVFVGNLTYGKCLWGLLGSFFVYFIYGHCLYYYLFCLLQTH